MTKHQVLLGILGGAFIGFQIAIWFFFPWWVLVLSFPMSYILCMAWGFIKEFMIPSKTIKYILSSQYLMLIYFCIGQYLGARILSTLFL